MALSRLTLQPPPLPHPAITWPLNVAGAVLGALAYFVVMYRFQTYHERNNMPGGTYLLFSAIMFLLGFLLGLFATRSPLRAAGSAIAGVFAAHAAIIAVDLQEDPTNHNLLPFEFIYFFVLASPALPGAWLARFAKRPAAR